MCAPWPRSRVTLLQSLLRDPPEGQFCTPCVSRAQIDPREDLLPFSLLACTAWEASRARCFHRKCPKSPKSAQNAQNAQNGCFVVIFAFFPSAAPPTPPPQTRFWEVPPPISDLRFSDFAEKCGSPPPLGWPRGGKTRTSSHLLAMGGPI